MRVTGGVLGGREVKSPGGRVRPTMDRVRAALFSILGPGIAGCRFLDLFAGSGAVGLEAWSRGAGHVCWVELDPRVLAVLKRNVSGLCDGHAQVIRADALGFARKRLEAPPFSIVFCDPPYDREGRRNVRGTLLDGLKAGNVLADGGLAVVEQETAEAVPPHDGWELVDDRVYGRSRLLFLKRKGA